MSPRLPPVAMATCRREARSTIVSSPPGPPAGPPLCETNSSPSSREPEHHLGLPLGVEPDHVAAIRPGGAPEGAVGREGQAADAFVAEVPETEAARVEDLDAVAGGDVDAPGGRVEGEGLRQAVAV